MLKEKVNSTSSFRAACSVGWLELRLEQAAKINLTIEREKLNHMRVYGLPSSQLIDRS